jgi:hypothetical protein
MERPSMKMDGHPEHRMPLSEHDGTILPTMIGKKLPERSPAGEDYMDE